MIELVLAIVIETLIWKFYLEEEIKNCKCIKDFFIEPDGEIEDD